MKTLQNISMIITLAISICMNQLSAKETQQHTEQLTSTSQMQVLDKKIVDIQRKIDVLESKGKQNLSRDDQIKRMYLKKELLATMRAKTATQKEIIAEEDKKQQAEKKKQQAYDRINETLKSIQGTLSSEGTTK